jgi:protein TorT
MVRGRIVAAPFDDPALQGRLAIEYAVRAIEGSIDYRQIGPAIKLATQTTLPPATALAPAEFRPEFLIP